MERVRGGGQREGATRGADGVCKRCQRGGKCRQKGAESSVEHEKHPPRPLPLHSPCLYPRAWPTHSPHLCDESFSHAIRLWPGSTVVKS